MEATKPNGMSRNKKIGIGCCGCAALSVPLLVILAVIGTIVGPSEPTVNATSTATTTPAVTPKASTTPAESASPSPAPATSNPAPKSSEKPKKTPQESADEWAKQVETDALMGATDWNEVCGGDHSRGVCWIAEVYSTQEGQLKVKMQLAGSDAESQGLAESAINYIFSSAGPGHEELEWVIVEDSSGTVIMQKSRSEMRAL